MLLAQHNVTLEQVTEMLAAQAEPSPVRRIMIDGIREFRITERDSRGDISAFELIPQTRH